MTSMTHDELRELTGGYVLGALSEAERHALEAHLALCPECSREVRELAGIADGLALAVPQVDPPPALRARVLQAAQGDRRVRVATNPSHRSTRAALPVWLATAASIAAVALGLYALTLRQQVGLLQDRLREANARAEGVQRELQIARASLDRSARTEAILSAADLRAIDLNGQKAAPASSGRAYWSPSSGLVVTTANLPELPADRQYQLWIIPPGGKPLDAGLFTRQPDGRAVLLVDAMTAAQIGTVAVTIEPAGGVPQPTGDMVLAGEP